MSLRRLLPYAMIVVLFAGIYRLTMVIPASWFDSEACMSSHFTLAMAVMLTIFLVICLEILQRSLFYFIKKTVIVRYIPRWLRMDNTTT